MLKKISSLNFLSSLKIRLPLLFILATAIPLIIFSVFSYNQVKTIFMKQKLGDMMNIIDAKYIHTLDYLDKGKAEIALDAKFFAEPLEDYYVKGDNSALITIKNKLNEAIKLNKFNKKHPFNRQFILKNRFSELMVIGQDGHVLVSTRSAANGRNLSDSSSWRRGKKGVFIKDAYRDTNNQVVFEFVAPITSTHSKDQASLPETGGVTVDKDELLGVLVAKVPAKYLLTLVNGELGNMIGGALWFAGYSDSTTFYIMNKEGYKITGTGMPKGYKTTLNNFTPPLKTRGSELPLQLGVNTGAKGDRMTNVGMSTGGREVMDTYKNRRGEMVAGASMVVFDMPWILVIEQNTKDAFAPIIQLKKSLFLPLF